MNKRLPILLLALAAAALAIALAIHVVVQTSVDESLNEVACTMDAKICPDGSAVGRIPPTCEFAPCPEPDTSLEGWETHFADGYTIAYPADMGTNDLPDDGFNIYFTGPTQAMGTELYDGFSITLNTGMLGGSTLAAHVENLWAEKQSDPIYVWVGNISPVALGSANGYEFSEEALGEFRNIYLPLAGNRYLHISVISVDPGNLGFDTTVEMILATLKYNQ